MIAEDLDYPHGIGQLGNSVFTHFVSFNIPGNWTELSDENSQKTFKGQNLVVLGRNDEGTFGYSVPCPSEGVHRIRFTVWALNTYYPTPVDNRASELSYRELLPWLEEHEVVRANFFGKVTAEPPVVGVIAK